MHLNSEIESYINANIIPLYAAFDPAHQIDHVTTVIANSMEYLKYFTVNPNMVYVVGAFHDLGLSVNRKEHHIHSGKILLANDFLPKHFSKAEIALMQEAVEDHRASNKHRPRNDYGLIVAEADRDISYQTILRRTALFTLGNNPELSYKEHFSHVYDHIREKYGEGGYLKLWLDFGPNKHRLEQLRTKINSDDFTSDIEKTLKTEGDF